MIDPHFQSTTIIRPAIGTGSSRLSFVWLGKTFGVSSSYLRFCSKENTTFCAIPIGLLRYDAKYTLSIKWGKEVSRDRLEQQRKVREIRPHY